MEKLATFCGGALLAKILYKLEKPDILSICLASRCMWAVCKKYQMVDRLHTDSVYMFGNGESGALGDDNTNNNIGIPKQIQCIPKVATISCGGSHTGILTVDGSVYMFGAGLYGVLGDGYTSDHDVGIPRKIQGIPKAASISCGDMHTGIVTVDGDVYMFGGGYSGILGDGNIYDHYLGVPLRIQGIPKVTVVSCGNHHTGIVTVEGNVYMFGDGKFGVLGDGNIDYHEVAIPKRIQGISKVAAISCGDAHTGIVTIDGDVYMFGGGLNGKLGDGDDTFHTISVPRRISGIPKVTTISCGVYHTGILTVDKDVYMFGNGAYGRLGDGDSTFHTISVPRRIQGIPKVIAVSCGEEHTGILTIEGDVYMFGNGLHGRLGDSYIWDHSVGVPKQIQGIPKAASISCGERHTGIVTIPESALELNIY